MHELTIIGGGLAGCEAAFQAAERGISVTLYEMRPDVTTAAHSTGNLAELVCSNSLGSLLPDRASGLLMSELQKLNSVLLQIARSTSVPSGSSLSVDREAFSIEVEKVISNHSLIRVVREELCKIPSQPTIIATGPLTSHSLSKSLMDFSGHQNLFFFDAVAPIVYGDSINYSIAFSASRFASEKGQTADYINCPLSKKEFDDFVAALTTAQRIPLKTFEEEIDFGVKAGKGRFFEGCLPIEVIASRGTKSLGFGPMRPIGLLDPRTNQRPHAVLQLRQENLSASLYNMVGFQTNLIFSEQKRVFRMIPGLEKAEFARMGQMHRNTYLCSPQILLPSSQTQKRPDLFLAGQIIGIEGYLGNIASGLLAGINAANYLKGVNVCIFPPTTMLGALYHYITECPNKSFQPMKANFGLLPELKNCLMGRLERAAQYVDSASQAMDGYLVENSEILGLT